MPSQSIAPIVTLHLWGVARQNVPFSMSRMVTQRRALRASHGLRFSKLLGTSTTGSFMFRDADLRHWAILAVWDSEADVRVFEHGSVVSEWDRKCSQRASVVMRPLQSRGTWAKQAPFEPTSPAPWDGPVASITRSRLKIRTMATFWRAVPPIAQAVRRAPGLQLATGIGELPVGLQGTFSMWESTAALQAFAYETTAHAQAIRDTERIGWYSEELFARFAVLKAAGSFNDQSLADIG